MSVAGQPPVVATPEAGAEPGRWRKHALAVVFLAPAAFFLLIWVVYPTLSTIKRSFYDRANENFVWFVFPLFGWGVGLTMHYLHAVRWADRESHERQTKIEAYCERCGDDLVRATRDATAHQPLG